VIEKLNKKFQTFETFVPKNAADRHEQALSKGIIPTPPHWININTKSIGLKPGSKWIHDKNDILGYGGFAIDEVPTFNFVIEDRTHILTAHLEIKVDTICDPDNITDEPINVQANFKYNFESHVPVGPNSYRTAFESEDDAKKTADFTAKHILTIYRDIVYGTWPEAKEADYRTYLIKMLPVLTQLIATELQKLCS
jgi:hypothetical protein